MRLPLDTHIFLWYISIDPRLPATFQSAIREPSNDVYLSAVSIWEAVVKHGLGKLPLPAPPADYLPRQREAHGIAALPTDEEAPRPPARDTPRSIRPHACCSGAPVWTDARHRRFRSCHVPRGPASRELIARIRELKKLNQCSVLLTLRHGSIWFRSRKTR